MSGFMRPLPNSIVSSLFFILFRMLGKCMQGSPPDLPQCSFSGPDARYPFLETEPAISFGCYTIPSLGVFYFCAFRRCYQLLFSSLSTLLPIGLATVWICTSCSKADFGTA